MEYSKSTRDELWSAIPKIALGLKNSRQWAVSNLQSRQTLPTAYCQLPTYSMSKLKKEKQYPPKLPLRFFRWFCHPKLRDSIEGDLMELYEERKAQSGKLKADLKFIVDVLLLFRPGIIKPTEGYQHLNTYGMFKSYFKISLRHLIKNKMLAFINVSSLAVGLAACVVIYLFVSDERSFDAFHSKNKNIYRLDEVQKFTGTNEQKVALSMPGMAPAMKRDFPEVQSYVRFWQRGKQLITKEDTKHLIENVMVVDSTFFDVFDFPLVQGDINTCLDRPLTILLTESTALKFFKTTSEALNNTVSWDGRDYQVTGILKDVPENSHIQFDALLSMVTYTSGENNVNDSWGGNWMTTYLLLEPNVEIKSMEEKFPAFLSRYMDDPQITSSISCSFSHLMKYTWLLQISNMITLTIENLTDRI